MNRRHFVALGAGVASGMIMPRFAGAETAFRLPEESAPHERTFMQWPVSTNVHPDQVFLSMLQQSIADVANMIAQFEPVVMLMESAHQAAARKKLSGQVEIWDIATDDLWARDSGPMFVVDGSGKLAVRQLNFNGWGGKQVHANDGQIAKKVADRLGLPLLDNGLVGEPGGVEFDGVSTLIAHESSWVNRNRNSGTKEEIEAKLLEAFGAKKMIWAPGVAGADITDYHIDALARFVAPGKVLVQLPDEVVPGDPWSKSAYETYDILVDSRDAEGRPLDLEIIPEPYDTRVTADDFVASYVNYYVCNGAVIAAQFGDKEIDDEASATLRRAYPGREVVTLNVDPIGETGGGIHCATREQPKV